jgi:hypothetical protein
MKGRLMKRITVVHAILFAVVMAVLLTGCSSTASTSNGVLQCAEDEVMLAGYQAGNVASSFGSLGTEVTMPLWFISGK